MTKNGPPSHPWSGGSSDEPYTEPADPWGTHSTAAPEAAWGTHPTATPEAAWGSHPASMPPVMDSSVGYPGQNYSAAALNAAPAAWGPPVAPLKRRTTPIVAVVIILGLLICGGLGTTAWLLQRDDTTGEGATPIVASAAPTDDTVGNPQSRPSEDARFVAKGQCVRNEGTAAKPVMKIVACASGTFEVLMRVDGRTTGEADAESKCGKVTSYTKWYFYDSELDSLDFVLCLRER